MAIVKIVVDPQKGKLRAQAPDGGWVRFPNDLRIQGAMYECNLIEGKSGSWIAQKPIARIDGVKAKSEKPFHKIKSDLSKKKPVAVNDEDWIADLKKIAGGE